MTDHDDSDTGARPTEQVSAPTTELQSAEHSEPPQAELLDDAAEADSARTPNWYIRAAVLIFLAVLVTTMMMPTITNFISAFGSKPVAPESKPSTVPATAPPSAPTVASRTPDSSDYDKQFLSLMTQEGWGCTDNSSADQCKKQMVNFAHQICSYSGQPIDVIYQKVGLPEFLGPREERSAIAKAAQSYPNCTFIGKP